MPKIRRASCHTERFVIGSDSFIRSRLPIGGNAALFSRRANFAAIIPAISAPAELDLKLVAINDRAVLNR